jgi:hypothetical protein
MPDKKQPVGELSTPDLMKHLFPKKVVAKAKAVAHEKDRKKTK